MPLDLGDHTARLDPTPGLIAEVGMKPPHLVRWSPDRAFEQVADPVLQDPVCRQPDRILDPLRFEKLVDLGIGKAGVSPEIDARNFALISRHDRLKHAIPSVGAVGVRQSCKGLTSDFGSRTTTILISDFELLCTSPRKSVPGDFGLLQHYRHITDMTRCPM